MKILLTTGIYPPEIGGPATYSQAVARALRGRGHEVTIIAYGDGYPKEANVVWVSRRGGPIVRYVRFAWKAFFLARLHDVVYAQGAVSEGFSSWVGSFFARRPLVVRLPGDYAWEMAQQMGEKDLLDEFLEKRHSGRIRLYEWMERWVVRRVRFLIAPSKYLAGVAKRWGIATERIFVIPNAVEPLPQTQGYEVEREAFGVSGKTVILTAGRAVPWKGVGELIEWWKELSSTHLLVYAGDGPELERWKALAEKNGVDDRVLFLGRIDRMTLARWFDAADAFVLHSGYEGWSHVATEAVSRDVPCLVSDRGGNPETKEMFPDLVQVLPYMDKGAWVEALKKTVSGLKRSETRYQIHHSWTHEKMVETVERVLSHQVRLQTVMISYDQGLLDPDSDVSKRIADLGDENVLIKPLVISRGTKNKNVVQRIWTTVWQGRREVRKLPGGTLITAQDPFVAGLIGYVISRLTNSPLEIQEHGDFFSGYWAKESWRHRLSALIGRFLLRRADHVRVVSERVKQHVVRLGVDLSKIDVIPVAQSLSQVTSNRSQVTGSFTLVAPCRFVWQKGLDVLIEAVRLLKKDGHDVRLRLIGAGVQEANLHKQAEGLPVEIIPWQPMEKLWDEADLFVLSSRYEGWGRTVVEAMAAGVPVVATEVGCVGSFFRPGVDGLVVPLEDPQALADAIAYQMTHPEEREKMRQCAQEQAKTFRTQKDLHDGQRAGWKRTLGSVVRQEVGPRWDVWVFAFVLFAVTTRLASAFLFHDSLVNREWGFFYLVQNWLNGHGYSYAAQLGCASAYRSPGFLFFLTALYSIFDPSNTLAQALVQNAFVVGVLWLVYAVGKRLVGKRGALLGAFFMAIYPYTFYHYTQYYHTFLSSFFLLLLVWFLLRLKETKRMLFAVGAGVSIACLAYIQGTILIATPLLVAWLLWNWWPDWKKTLQSALIMAVVSAGLIAPWTYRNWKVFHHFVPLTTDLGHGLFKANNEVIYELTKRGYPQEIVDVITVSSTNPFYKQYRLPVELEEELKRDGVFRDAVYWTMWHPQEPVIPSDSCQQLGPLNEYDFNQYWIGQAKAWIRENWWTEGLKLQALKLKTFWQPSLFPSVKTGAPWSFADNPLKVALARWSVTLASAVVIFGGWVGLLWLIVKRDKNVWLVLAMLITYTALHTIFAGYTKYRIPLDNLLAVYAGWLIIKIFSRR